MVLGDVPFVKNRDLNARADQCRIARPNDIGTDVLANMVLLAAGRFGFSATYSHDLKVRELIELRLRHDLYIDTLGGCDFADNTPNSGESQQPRH